MLYFYYYLYEAKCMTEQNKGINQDACKRLRLRTSPGSHASAESPANGASADTAVAEKAVKADHHKAGLVIVLVILLLFVAGGYGLYKVLSYSSAEKNARETSGSEAVLRSARVQTGTAVRESEQQSSVDVIVGTSEEPVLTVFETPLEAPVTSAEVVAQSDAAVDVDEFAGQVRESPPSDDQSEAISKYIASRFIGSVRLGETDPRVILDGRSYSRGESIEGPYGIRFIAAREGVLYFEDDAGIVYRRRF